MVPAGGLEITTSEEKDMLQADVGFGYDITLKYNGALDGVPVVTVTDATVCAAKLVSYDTETETAVVSLDHTGVVGVTEVSVSGDGDLGDGVRGVIWTETFEGLDAGATSVAVSVSAQRPTPAPVA